MSTLYIITGPAGVGKSSISNKLVKKLAKGCLIEGDDIYHLVKTGYVAPWKQGNHLELFWKNSLDLIKNSLDAGFDVVFNYIILKEDFEKIKQEITGHDIKFVVLLADERTLLMRDGNRAKDCQMGERCLILLQEFIDEKYDTQYILNTSDFTIQQTVEQVLKPGKFLVK